MPHNPRILIAEDDPSVRDLVQTRLALAGYETATARSGVDALEQIRTNRPHAMVLDLGMPELDGFGVLEALPRLIGAARLPVLVLTARHTAEDVRLALQLGAKDYLSKPFHEVQLLARVGRLFRPALAAAPRRDDKSTLATELTWL